MPTVDIEMVQIGTVLVSIAAFALAGGFFVLAMLFASQILIAAYGRGGSRLDDRTWTGRLAVLVPAHNEAEVIGATITSLKRQLRPGDRVVVVADNCTDATAELCTSLGAEVVERNDLERRGKGYALARGIEHLAADPPDVVIVLDADCTIEGDGLYRLAAASHTAGRPVQSLYELILPEAPGVELRIGALAWRVKNHLRPLGLLRVHLPCQLMGSGMAFPWNVIRSGNLETGHIVEDMMLGLDLARRGYPPQFLPSVRTISPFPQSREGQQTQRARWETGHLQVIMKSLPRRFVEAVVTADLMLAAMVVDAAIPPIAFLVLSGAGLVALGAVLALAGGGGGPLVLALAGFIGLGCAVVVAWWHVGQDILSRQDLLRMPAYALGKVSIYGRALAGGRLAWVRSKRS